MIFASTGMIEVTGVLMQHRAAKKFEDMTKTLVAEASQDDQRHAAKVTIAATRNRSMSAAQ